MDIRLLFPNQYLAAADLQGKDVTLTVSRIAKEKLRTEKGEEVKPVVYFVEMERRHDADPDKENKRLVLNKTCARAIAATHGSETDAWIGKKIVLYPTTCLAFGKTVDCIRVRADAAPAKKGREPGQEG
jgi:hypothetical protein